MPFLKFVSGPNSKTMQNSHCFKFSHLATANFEGQVSYPTSELPRLVSKSLEETRRTLKLAASHP